MRIDSVRSGDADRSSREPLERRIAELKRKHNAVILAHNYQLGEVQDIADFVGDSLELSQRAAATRADVIVFCGVRFMAETAKILSPERTVFLASAAAGCPMADMVTAPGLRALKAEHPEAAVVGYVNTTAEVKSECDICCTSANAVQVIATIPAGRKIIFVPDQHLGHYVRNRTDRDMILWPGYCATHVRILPNHIEERRRQFPDAKVIAHPECRADVAALADEVLSTSGMCRYAREAQAPVLIVATEIGMLHRLKKEAPQRSYVPATEQAVCPQMKLTELEDVLRSLESLEQPSSVKTPNNRIEISPDIMRRAEQAVRRMIAIAARG
jgi:quinolinate synthase